MKHGSVVGGSVRCTYESAIAGRKHHASVFLKFFDIVIISLYDREKHIYSISFIQNVDFSNTRRQDKVQRRAELLREYTYRIELGGKIGSDNSTHGEIQCCKD